MKKLFFAAFVPLVFLLLACGGKASFNDQIVQDVTRLMGTGICDSIPRGAVISNVVVGEIVPIGDSGLIDVSITYDFEHGGQKKNHADALLYSKKGNHYKLEKIGGCEYGD